MCLYVCICVERPSPSARNDLYNVGREVKPYHSLTFLALVVFRLRGVHSIDLWRQMPPGKNWGESKKLKTGGGLIFLMANCLKY